VIARVAVRDTDGVFDYLLPSDMEQYATAGIRVVVPFGASSRTTDGIITEICDKSEFEKLKTVRQLLDTEPLCTKELLELAQWLKENYFCNYYTALRCVMPPGVAYRVKRTINILVPDVQLKGAKAKVFKKVQEA